MMTIKIMIYDDDDDENDSREIIIDNLLLIPRSTGSCWYTNFTANQ